jgi:hypothetical protein
LLFAWFVVIFFPDERRAVTTLLPFVWFVRFTTIFLDERRSVIVPFFVRVVRGYSFAPLRSSTLRFSLPSRRQASSISPLFVVTLLRPSDQVHYSFSFPSRRQASSISQRWPNAEKRM